MSSSHSTYKMKWKTKSNNKELNVRQTQRFFVVVVFSFCFVLLHLLGILCTIHRSYTQSYVHFLNRSIAYPVFKHYLYTSTHSSMFHTQFTVVVVIVFPPAGVAAALTVCICYTNAWNLITTEWKPLTCLWITHVSHIVGHIIFAIRIMCALHSFFWFGLCARLRVHIFFFYYSLWHGLWWLCTQLNSRCEWRVPFWRIKASNT